MDRSDVKRIRRWIKIGALLLMVPAITVTLSCTDDPAEPAPVVTETTRDFESAWAAINQRYPLLEYKGIDWNAIHATYRPRAEAASGLEIYDILHDLLAELQDAHAFYRDPIFATVRPFTPGRVLSDIDAFSIDLVKTYFSAPLHLAGHGRINYGITANNLGYIHISTFAESGMMDDFHVVMDTVQNTDGLIIDIRGNLGGVAGTVEAVFGRFIDAPLPSFDAFTVDGPVILSPFEPDTSGFTYTNPVVILINGACASAPEKFAEMMKRIPTVTLMGDTTAGAGCWSIFTHPGTVTLPSGKIIFVPTTAMVRLDGQPWEWNGILPDTLIEQTARDILLGTDRQLEAAMDYLN